MKYTPLYEKGAKQNLISPMETTYHIIASCKNWQLAKFTLNISNYTMIEGWAYFQNGISV